MTECEVWIPFWCWTDNKWPLYFLGKLLENIKDVTDDRVAYSVNVLEDHSHPDMARELDERFGGGQFWPGGRPVNIVHFHEGEDLGQRGRNFINAAVKAPYFVILQPDVLVTRGWLYNLVTEMRMAEAHFAPKPCLISPTFLPYPMYDDRGLWVFHDKGDVVKSWAEMEAICRKWGIPFNSDDREVLCFPSSLGNVTDDGHRLMMYIASKEFATKCGEWDESYKAGGYEDNDAGIMAIMKGGKNLQSHTTFVHHLIGHSRSQFDQTNRPASKTNQQRFIEKWGQKMWDDMQDGSLWIRLHKEYA